jgi:type IV secretion system protein VirB9
MKAGLFLFSGLAFAAPTPKTEAAIDPTAGSRVIQVGEHDVVPLSARLRFTNVIVLPKEERILDYTCGDKEFWVVNGAENMAFVKPSKSGVQTNLNLVTAAGNVYSFVLSEGGDKSPDLKVFIEPKDGALIGSLKAGPRFVAASAVDDYRAQVELANLSLKKVREEADHQIKAAQASAAAERDKYRAQLPASMVFDYRYADQPEFKVAAIYHDDKFTYIRANPQETPALYEMQDEKPGLIEFRFENGLYTVDKIVNRGYLAIGKKKLHFSREPKP